MGVCDFFGEKCETENPGRGGINRGIEMIMMYGLEEVTFTYY